MKPLSRLQGFTDTRDLQSVAGGILWNRLVPPRDVNSTRLSLHPENTTDGESSSVHQVAVHQITRAGVAVSTYHHLDGDLSFGGSP